MHIPTKIPTIVGILMVVLIVGAIAVGSESYFRTATTASGSIQPANVEITNISDTTFTVSWTTQLAATGALSITTPHGTQVLFDDQDTKNQGRFVTTTLPSVRQFRHKLQHHDSFQRQKKSQYGCSV